MRVRFADFEFNSESHELLRQGRRVHLSPKAFRFLEVLLRNRSRALSKEDLQRHLWPDTFVSEENLSSLAAEIRRALGESGRHPQWLRTVYGFGYAFSGAAEDQDQPGSASGQCLIWGDREIPLAAGENLLGRGPGAVVRLDEPRVSRRHARILIQGDAAILEDLKSKNGTFLAGHRVSQPCPLSDGDQILIGSAVLTFRSAPRDQSTKTASGLSNRRG